MSDILLTEKEPSFPIAKNSDASFSRGKSLELRDVKFRYSPSDRRVVKNATFYIEPGEFAVITGPSGCGKSTLLSLILGLNEQCGGSVKIGGKSVFDIGIDGLRAQMGTVLQEDSLFAGTIADNISFFSPSADDALIQEAAASAALDLEIARMPMRYNTLVGDMGSALSGGQKQRLLIARALYKRPAVLLLDEATSHLDIENERLVSNNIRRLEITRLIVAHRPETIASADRILVMTNGIVTDIAQPS